MNQPTSDFPKPPPELLIAELVPPRAWGPWATLGWGLLAAAAFLAVQTGVMLLFVFVQVALDPNQDFFSVASGLEYNGLFLAFATLLANPAALILCALTISVRKYPLLDYLAVKRVSRRDLALGLGCIAVFIPLSDGLTWLSGRPVVPEFMVSAWTTAGFLPLLIMAVVVVAPVGEELFFRGFLYRGWSESRLGPSGATVFTAVPWALIHLQYDWFHITHIIAAGLMLGWLRHRSGSTLLTILLHVLVNLVATIEVAVKVELMS